jgi:DNA-binding MarR family transcriptional regulator
LPAVALSHSRPVQAQQQNAGGGRQAGGTPRLEQRPLVDPWRHRRGGSAQPVAWLARDLGAYRLNVQRVINELREEGLVAFEANPHHRRAQLVVLTDKGKRAFEAARNLQAPWVNRLADGLSLKDIETVHRVITAVRKKLEDPGKGISETTVAGPD